MDFGAGELGDELASPPGTHQFVYLSQKIVWQNDVCAPTVHIWGHSLWDIKVPLEVGGCQLRRTAEVPKWKMRRKIKPCEHAARLRPRPRRRGKRKGRKPA